MIADLVQEALDDDHAIARYLTDRAHLLVYVFGQAARRSGVEVMLFLQ